jgi:hypothetical protein
MNVEDLSTAFAIHIASKSDENRETFDTHYPLTERLNSQSVVVPGLIWSAQSSS